MRGSSPRHPPSTCLDPLTPRGSSQSQAVAGGRRRLRCPFLAKNPSFGAHVSVLWVVTPLRTYFLVLFAMKLLLTPFLFLTEKTVFLPESNGFIG